MKKHISIMVILVLLSNLIIGCGKQKDNMITDIIKNDITFIKESGNSVYLKDYRSTNFSETPVIEKYTLIDLDNDGSKELVAYTSQNHGFYIIFYKYEKNFYSFEKTEREFIDLKDDGTFMQSESALISKYLKLSFENNSPIITEKAYKNDIDNIYRINNAEVSYDTLKNYENSFRNKSSAEWIYLESKNSDNLDYTMLFNDFILGNQMAEDFDGQKSNITQYTNDQDFKYAFFDMNGDTVPELIVSSEKALSIFWIKENSLCLWHQTTSTTTLRNDGTLLLVREGAAPPHTDYIYTVLGYNGIEKYTLAFSEYSSANINGQTFSQKYFVNDCEVSKEVFEAVTLNILNLSDDEIQWQDCK